MKKFFAVFLLLVFCKATIAQSIFHVSPDTRRVNFDECQDNHDKILSLELKQLDSEIARLFRGIDIELRQKTHALTIYHLKKYLSELILRRIIIAKMQEQLHAEKLTKYFHANSKDYNHKIFKLDKMNLELDKTLQEEIDRALAENDNKHRFQNYLISNIKSQLAQQIAGDLATGVFKAIGSGMVAKLVAGTISSSVLEGALVNFGIGVLKGAGIGVVISLVTEPLYGSRPAPESMWIDLLEDYPEMMINPEWMNQAGVPDHAWSTHCYTIARRTEAMERILRRFIASEENSFKQGIAAIFENTEDYIKKQQKNKNILKYEVTPMAQDNTYVYKYIPIEAKIPLWASEK